jgi:hypothetical protein
MPGPVLVGTQTNSGSAAGTNVTVTLGSAITAGNMLVAMATTDDATVPAAGEITDTTGSNVWTLLKTQADNVAGTRGGCGIYVCRTAAAGSYGVKFTHSTSFVALSVSEMTPNGQAGTDGTSGALSTSGAATVDPGSVTTTNADNTIFCAAADAGATTTWTIGSGYTLLSCVTSNANTNVGAQYRSFSTTVSGQSTAFGNTSANGWTACAAAIKAVATTFRAPPSPKLLQAVNRASVY